MKFPAQFRDRLLPITLSQFVGLLCGLGGMKIATRLVSPTDYGIYGVFLSFAPLGMWVVHAGLIKFTQRHWAASPDRGALLREVLRAAWRKLPWLAGATLAAAYLMHTPNVLITWAALLFAAMMLSLGLLLQSAMQAERAHWADLAVTANGSITRSFIPPLLYSSVGSSMLALQTGYCIHTALFTGSCLYLLHKYQPKAASPAPQLKPIYEGQLFVVLSLAGWLLTAVNRWIVATYFGPEQAGFFTLGTNITQIATSMLAIIFVQYFQPGIFALASEEPGKRRQLAHQVDLIALAFCGLALVGVVALRLVAPWLVGPLINEKYRSALGMIIPAGFFSVAIITAQFYDTMLLAGHREKSCAPVDIVTTLVLTTGGLGLAWLNEPTYLIWLAITPLVPWLISRPLARRYYFMPKAEAIAAK